MSQVKKRQGKTRQDKRRPNPRYTIPQAVKRSCKSSKAGFTWPTTNSRSVGAYWGLVPTPKKTVQNTLIRMSSSSPNGHFQVAATLTSRLILLVEFLYDLRGGGTMDHVGSLKSAFWMVSGSLWLVVGSLFP